MAQLPPKLSLSPADAQELLRFLELRLDVDGCDNTHRFTRSWAASEDLDPEQVVEFVKRHGGFHCDCEVVENAKSIGVGEKRGFPHPPVKSRSSGGAPLAC